MAIWQVDLKLAPKDKLNTKDSIENLEFSSLWSRYNISKDSIEEVGKVLKRTDSWSNDIVQLGDISSNVIELFFEEGNISEVTCRLDLRNLNIEIMDTILRFIWANDLAVIVDNRAYMEINREVLVDIIKKSEAYRFINDPKVFLELLGKCTGCGTELKLKR